MPSLFDRDEFKPYAERWRRRTRQYAERRSYCDGSVYRGVRHEFLAFGPRLAREIRPLYLPLARAVHLDAGIVPGKWTLAPRALQFERALRQVFAWSDWETNGVLLTRWGAMFGSVGLKVADLRTGSPRRVTIRPVSPETFMLVESSAYDPTPAMALVVDARVRSDGRLFEYGEVITPHAVRTFVDGEPAGFAGRPPEYANDLGFVPFVELHHIETGDGLGECTFANAVPLLDEVNDLASDLASMIKKHAEPQWAIIGAEAGDLEKGSGNVWYIPSGGDAKPLVAGMDIQGVLDFIREIRDNVHAALPELAFDELRKKDQVATATVELQLMELKVKIELVRPNYDHGLANALRLAGLAAASMGLASVAALATDELAFDAAREVLPLDPLTRLEIEKRAAEVDKLKRENIAERALNAGG